MMHQTHVALRACIMACLCAGAAYHESRQAAQTAYRNGDSVRAITLLDEELADHPDHAGQLACSVRFLVTPRVISTKTPAGPTGV